jgi:hypothetical protein
LQNSALVIDDAVVAFTGITGNASTDIITVTGSAFTNGQRVRFSALTGGGGLNTTTNYFVIAASGETFQLSTTEGGSFVNFTTNITAGTLLTGHVFQPSVVISQNTTEANSALVLFQKGTGAFILGSTGGSGGNARGANAVDLSLDRASVGQVASGASSFNVGRRNTASNSFAMCLGVQNTASGNSSSCLGGSSNTASAIFSATIGGTSAIANREGMLAHATGAFSAASDAQHALFVLRCQTTTDSAVEMALDGSAIYLTIPSGKVIFCNIKVVGVKSGGSAVATYERQYAVKNVAGTSTEIYAPVTIGTDNAAGTTLAVSCDDTGDFISIKPTGIASETWRWVASVDAVEVAYGS